MNDLSPSEIVELAEFISCYSQDDDGNTLPLAEAMQIVETTDAYNLQLSPSNYLIYLKFIQTVQKDGPLMPVNKLPDVVSKYLLDMYKNGYSLLSQIELRKCIWKSRIVCFCLGALLTAAICFITLR